MSLIYSGKRDRVRVSRQVAMSYHPLLHHCWTRFACCIMPRLNARILAALLCYQITLDRVESQLWCAAHDAPAARSMASSASIELRTSILNDRRADVRQARQLSCSARCKRAMTRTKLGK